MFAIKTFICGSENIILQLYCTTVTVQLLRFIYTFVSQTAGLGLGLGLINTGLGLGLGLDATGLGLGLGLAAVGLDYKSGN